MVILSVRTAGFKRHVIFAPRLEQSHNDFFHGGIAGPFAQVR